MTTMAEKVEAAVRKSITVSATPETAFEIVTADFDSWWLRTSNQ